MGYFFGFTGRCAYNSCGVGGAYKQKFMVCTPVYQYFIYTVCHISPDKGLCDFVGADL